MNQTRLNQGTLPLCKTNPRWGVPDPNKGVIALNRDFITFQLNLIDGRGFYPSGQHFFF